MSFFDDIADTVKDAVSTVGEGASHVAQDTLSILSPTDNFIMKGLGAATSKVEDLFGGFDITDSALEGAITVGKLAIGGPLMGTDLLAREMGIITKAPGIAGQGWEALNPMQLLGGVDKLNPVHAPKQVSDLQDLTEQVTKAPEHGIQKMQDMKDDRELQHKEQMKHKAEAQHNLEVEQQKQIEKNEAMKRKQEMQQREAEQNRSKPQILKRGWI